MGEQENDRDRRISTGGGASIEGNVDTRGGDFIGRDKIEEHVYLEAGDREEKSGCLLFIERSFTFVFSLVLGGIVLGIFGALIGAVAGGGEDGAMIGAVIGAILGLGFAIIATGNISRYRGR